MYALPFFITALGNDDVFTGVMNNGRLSKTLKH